MVITRRVLNFRFQRVFGVGRKTPGKANAPVNAGGREINRLWRVTDFTGQRFLLRVSPAAGYLRCVDGADAHQVTVSLISR